jgi:hypothetical protein
MPKAVVEAGSFRDRTARVFYDRGEVYRGLNQAALKNWQTLSVSRVYERALNEGRVVASELCDLSSLTLPDLSQWAAVLRHEKIPVISYPYEWSFGMLRDAALLQLDLLEGALGEQMTLKDATPYNIQWRGAAPVFVDIASFETWKAGEPWVGYRQFCQLFLYPLLLMAYRGVPFQPWLRGSLEGMDADTCRKLMSARDLLRPGVLSHVVLQAGIQNAYQDTSRNVKTELRDAGFGVELIQANVKRLRKLISGLRWKQDRSTWSGYKDHLPYDADDTVRKQAFVRKVVSTRDWNLVWDLGCNTGSYSRIAAERARTVVALDADHLAIDRFYEELKADGNRKILPLVGNLADPSPDLGWQNLERRRLIARGHPDLVLCLALTHHMVIGANIPLTEWLGWLGDLRADLVIEFVTRQDPMVEKLLRNKAETHDEYDLANFERELNARFSVLQRESLGSGTRFLYHARPHDRS